MLRSWWDEAQTKCSNKAKKAYVACWPLVNYGKLRNEKKNQKKNRNKQTNKQTKTNLMILDKGKEDNDHSKQIKLNNFIISLWDKRRKNLISNYFWCMFLSNNCKPFAGIFVSNIVSFEVYSLLCFLKFTIKFGGPHTLIWN